MSFSPHKFGYRHGRHFLHVAKTPDQAHTQTLQPKTSKTTPQPPNTQPSSIMFVYVAKKMCKNKQKNKQSTVKQNKTNKETVFQRFFLNDYNTSVLNG